jgi:uncharacterized protein YyaL (SSP411 family)
MRIKRKRYICLVIIVIIGGLYAGYLHLASTNKYVTHWHNLPMKVKTSAVVLSLESFNNMFFPPKIDTNITNKITRPVLLKAVKNGADFIVNMQEKTGRYQYWYDPVKDVYSPKHKDNFLRQAGTSYAMMLVYEATGDSTYLKSAKKSLQHLMKFKKDLRKDKSYFFFNRKAKLGGIALPLLTMNKLYNLCNDSAYVDDMEKLAKMIIHLQQYYGNGKFKSTYVYRGDYEYEKHSGWESSIYPGEAMLAMALMYKNFGKEEYKKCFDDAFEYYAKNGNWKMTGFVPWALTAFAEMYFVTKNQEYADFTFEMCDFGLTWQNLDPKYNVYGSIYPLPDVFTSTTFEGIGDAIKVAEISGNQDLAKKYKQRSLIAYHWILKLQYHEGHDVPKDAIGGFRKNFYRPKIRIDNTQHAISAMTKGLKYIFNTQGKHEQKTTE